MRGSTQFDAPVFVGNALPLDHPHHLATHLRNNSTSLLLNSNLYPSIAVGFSVGLTLVSVCWH